MLELMFKESEINRLCLIVKINLIKEPYEYYYILFLYLIFSAKLVITPKDFIQLMLLVNN